MNELTKREQIALAIYKETLREPVISGPIIKPITSYKEKLQKDFCCYFEIADLFLSISEDTTGESIEKTEECPICLGTGNKLNSINLEQCFNCGGAGKIAVYGKSISEMENFEARR